MNSSDRIVEKPLNSLFRMAVLAGVENTVRLHLNRGDDLNARDGSGMTPLMLAASKNKAPICSLLLLSGADLNLQDLNGRDALTIARDAGAVDALAAMAPFATRSNPEISEAIAVSVHKTDLENLEEDLPLRGREEAPDSDDNDEVSSFGWEAEEDLPAPPADDSLIHAATASYVGISSHIPVDTSEDWGDFEVFLPDTAVPLPKVGRQEARERTFRILRRALREGSIPERTISELFESDDESSHDSDETFLKMVLADIGAETDERIEISEVYDDWSDTLGNDDEVAEALLHFEDLRSGRNAPMRHYMRDVQKISKLLTAAEEIELAKSMEEGLHAAVDILASWPAGMAAFLAASERIGPCEVELDLDSELALDESPEPLQDSDDENIDDLADDELRIGELSKDAKGLRDKLNSLKFYAKDVGIGGANEIQLRQALYAVKPSPGFLANVAELCVTESCEYASVFKKSLRQYVEAKERLTLANLRLVISFVKKYQAFGLPFDDLIQEGNLGLMKAADRFEWRKGYRFATYATWWIRQSATRAIPDKAYTIRTPVHLHDSILKMEKEVDAMERLTGLAPSSQVLADKLSMPRKKVESLRARLHEPISLTEPDASGFAPADRAMDDSFVCDPYALAERSSLLATLGRMLAGLPAKDAELLEMRFGLDGNGQKTLEEIGLHFGVTRERIRQIEAATLKKLAQPSRSDALRTFLDGDSAAPRLMTASSAIQIKAFVQPRKERKPRQINNAELHSVEGIVGATLDDPRKETQFLPIARPKGASPTDRAIAIAKAAGARVVDGRDTGNKVIVVLDSEESQLNVVIRTLLNAGFERYAGMEFRK